MYATGVGLVLKGFEYIEHDTHPPTPCPDEPEFKDNIDDDNVGIKKKILNWFTEEEDNY